MKKKLMRLLFLAASLLVINASVYAGNDNEHDGNGQGTGQGSGNVTDPADPNNEHGSINEGDNYNNGVNKADAPFDAGLSVLLGAGALAAAKKIRNRKQATTNV
jgi:hypothetical protein